MSWLPRANLRKLATIRPFWQKFLASNLGRLMEALKIMRRGNGQNPKTERQIKEGADLAVKLADRLHSGDHGN
jgi:hypothetical protein